ncbi:MAG TPA: hypothetical protein VH540_25810 [Ktedonobacterales bacterium]
MEALARNSISPGAPWKTGSDECITHPRPLPHACETPGAGPLRYKRSRQKAQWPPRLDPGTGACFFFLRRAPRHGGRGYRQALVAPATVPGNRRKRQRWRWGRTLPHPVSAGMPTLRKYEERRKAHVARAIS